MYVVSPGDGSGKVQPSVKDEFSIMLAVICPGWGGTKQKWNRQKSINPYMFIGNQRGKQHIGSVNYIYINLKLTKSLYIFYAEEHIHNEKVNVGYYII